MLDMVMVRKEGIFTYVLICFLKGCRIAKIYKNSASKADGDMKLKHLIA